MRRFSTAITSRRGRPKLFSALSLLFLSLLSCLIRPALSQADSCSTATTIAAGYSHMVALKADGTVVAVGSDGGSWSGSRLDVSSWTDIKAVTVGSFHTIGLKEDGTVVGVGNNFFGQLYLPGWKNIKAVAAGPVYTVGLKEDGTVVAAGNKWYGQFNVSSWTNIKAIAAGGAHVVGLKEDGTVVVVGNNDWGQLNVSSWMDIKAVAAGGSHTIGLKEDGTVVAVGYNGYGQLNVSSWANIKAIAAGADHTVGLKEDGTVVAVGDNRYGQSNVSSWSNITAMAAGSWITLGLKADGTVVAVVDNPYGQTDFSSWENIMQPVCGNTDTAPPVMTHAASGMLGNNGWYVSDVAILLTAADLDSGVKGIHYSVSGGVEVTVSGDTATVNLTSDGSQTVSYYAFDNAGNMNIAQSLSVNIDKTPPAGNISPSPGLLWPPNHKMVNVAVNGGSVDAASGVASVVFTVADEYGTVQPAVSGFNTTIPLEAWREGADMDGRHYTVTAVITDKAGNSTTVSTEAVCPHDMRDKK